MISETERQLETAQATHLPRLRANLTRLHTLRSKAAGGQLGTQDGTRTIYKPAEVAPLATKLKGSRASHANKVHGQTVSLLQHTTGASFLPAKLFELWETWRGDPARFETGVLELHHREIARAAQSRQGVKLERDFWCWWGGFTAWAARHWGKVGELFTGPINRTGPLHAGFSGSPEDVQWGLQFDAWAHDWDSLQADILLGNPPYHLHDIQRFCRKAEHCRTPVLGILPTTAAKADVQRLALQHGATVLGIFKANTCNFLPFKVWSGDTTHGMDDGRRAPFDVILVGWRIDPSVAAQNDFSALAHASCGGRWPLKPGSTIATPREQEPSTTRTALATADATVHSIVAKNTVDAERQAKTGQTRKPTVQHKGDSSRLLRNGPWSGLRWWSTDNEHSSHTADKDTWQRMARWGMVPISITDLLRFGGASTRSRTTFTRQSGRAIREAAAACVEKGRTAAHDARQAETTEDTTSDKARQPTKTSDQTLRGDRGQWAGQPLRPEAG